MSVLLYHERQSISCFFPGREQPVVISLPKEALSDIDIKDAELYVKTVNNALSGKEGMQKSPALLVLSDDVCFASVSSEETLEEDQKKFTVSTPFLNVQTIPVRLEDKVFLIATNADIFETASRAFTSIGFPVVLVVPRTVLLAQKLCTKEPFDAAAIKKITDAKQQLKAYGFRIPETHADDVPKNTDAKKQAKKPAVSFGLRIFIVIAALYAVGMVIYMLLQ